MRHVQSLQSLQASLATQLDQTHEHVASLQEEVAANATEHLDLVRLRREIEDLIDSRDQLDEGMHNARQELESVIIKWDNTKQELDGAREELISVARTYEETRRELEIISRELALGKVRVSSLEDQLEQSTRDNNGLEERIYELEEEIEGLRTETQDLNSKNEAVLMGLGELEIELHKAKIDAANAKTKGNKLHDIVVETQTDKDQVLRTVDEVRRTIRQLIGEMVAKLRDVEDEHTHEQEESGRKIDALEQQLKVCLQIYRRIKLIIRTTGSKCDAYICHRSHEG